MISSIITSFYFKAFNIEIYAANFKNMKIKSHMNYDTSQYFCVQYRSIFFRSHKSKLSHRRILSINLHITAIYFLLNFQYHKVYSLSDESSMENWGGGVGVAVR